MARRRHDDGNILEALLDLATGIPWWAGVLAAGAAYLALHALAGVRLAPARAAGELGSQLVWQFAIAAAGVFQYIIPLPLLAGAAVSAWRGRRNPRATPPLSHEPAEPGFPRLEDPDLPDAPAGPNHDAELAQAWQSAFTAAQQSGPDATTWTLDLLRALEWKRFEDVCAELCRHLGFEARTQRQGADGGVDIHLYRPPVAAPAAIVQCKSWNTYRVGVKPVRELLGVMTAARVTEGIFMTSATFTREALDFGRDNGIDCMDGEALVRAIRSLPEAAQHSMLAAATAGDYLTPTCASCGIKLVKRERKEGGEGFWGCSNYPKCRLTMKLR